MKNLLFLVLLVPIIFIDYGCESNSVEPQDNDTTCVVDRKPNLYIYPKDTLNLSIEIAFPNGGEILESIPEYNDSWNVVVNPNGKIDNIYYYLYYECKIPKLTQKEYGWLIKNEKLKEFFEDNMKTSGFNQREINDFIEYWIPVFTDFEYYEIYPQFNETLKNMIEVKFSVAPDNFYRLHYLVIGRNDSKLNLIPPHVEVAKREKYFSVEWGVILE